MEVLFILAPMQIAPVDPQWIHTYLLEPCLLGCERLNRVWGATDFSSPQTDSPSLRERIVLWIEGIAVLSPIVNTIIWITWKTFGDPDPEKMIDPFCPEVDPPPPPAPAPLPFVPIKETPKSEIERYRYHEIFKSGKEITTNWTIEHLADTIVIKQDGGEEFQSTSIYRRDWTQIEYHIQLKDETFDLLLIEPKKIQVKYKKETKLTEVIFDLEESIPWIQQIPLGLHSFIDSDKKQTNFYFVLPPHPLNEKIELTKMVAHKEGVVEVPGHGKCTKVTYNPTSFFQQIFKGTLYLDPITKQLRKFEDPSVPMFKQTGGSLLENQSPQ